MREVHNKGIGTHLAEMVVVLGPAPCQGCGEPVVYMRHGYARGWLHESGNLWCAKRVKAA